MHTAGNTLDESIALGTAANSIVQDPEKVGTAIRTISMYLRSAKTDLEDAGESVDGMVESTPKLQALLKSLAGVDILQSDGQTFKSTYQILKELSEVWDDLTDVNKASIFEAIGGKRNANVTSALLTNFSEAEKVLATSQDSAGSALSENEKYLDSINGKIDQLKAKFEDISRKILSSDTVKWVADLLQNILKLADGLDKIGMLLPTIFTTIASKAGLGIAGTDKLGNSTLFGKTKEQRAANRYLGSVVDQPTLRGILRPGINLTDDELKSLKAFNAEITSGTDGFTAWNNHLSKSSEYVQNLGQELEVGTISMGQIETATTKASTAMTIFNSIKSFGINLAIAAGVKIVTSLISKINDWEGEIEKIDNKISQSEEKIQQYQSEIDSLKSAQEQLTEAKGNKEELVKVQENLNKLLGDAPDLINGEADAYNQAQQKISDQIAIDEKALKAEQDKVVRYNKEKFKANQVKKEGLLGDWSAADMSGDSARSAAKMISKAAQEYAKTKKLSYDDAYEKVFEAASDTGKYATMFGGTAGGVFSDLLNIRDLGGVTAADWEDYWNGQVSTALEVFKTTIDNYNGYGGANFIREVIEGMVRSGFTLEEINTQISAPELDALKGTYFQGLIDELNNARAKGDTDAAGTALDNIKKAIDNLKNACPSAETYLDSLWDTIANGAKKTEETANSVESFTDKIKGITTANKDISSKQKSVGDMLAELRDDGGLSADSLATIVDDFSGVEGYKNYLRVLTSSKSSIKEQQDAINGLYGAYIDQSGILDGLTAETADFTEAQLKARGVTNAHEVVTSRLIQQQIEEGGILQDVTADNFEYVKSQLEAAGVTNAADIATTSLASSLLKAAMDKGTLTEETIQSTKQLLLEKGASETVANQYVASAQACLSAQNSMSQALSEQTKSRIKNMGIELQAIKSVADAHTQMLAKMKASLGLTGVSTVMNQFSTLGQMKEYFDKKYGAGTWDALEGYGAQAAAAAEAQAKLNALVGQVSGVKTSIPATSSKAGSSGSSKSPEDLHKEAFDNWYTALKWQRDNNIIDEAEFLKQLDYVYQNHYADRSKYLEEYAKYSQEVYDGFKKMYQDDLNAQKDALEKQKDELKEIADARKQALDDAKDQEDEEKSRSEKREEISKLKVLIASFRGTLSLSSQKKLRELQQQLKEKEDELAEFESDKALDHAKDQIDKEYENQEKAINKQIENIESQLDKISKDLPEIRDLVAAFARRYGVTITRAYASGTSSVPAVTQENGAEIIAGNVRRGQFTMLTPTSKVWNASATQALWDFANSPAAYLGSVMDKISAFKQRATSMIYSQPVNVEVGGITVNGNADKQTVQEIKRGQKTQVEEILKAFKKLQ